MRSNSLLWPLAFLLILPGCTTGAAPTAAIPPTLAATSAPSTPTPVASPSPVPTATPVPRDSGWKTLQPGLEQRTLNLVEDNVWQESISLLRLDPKLFRFDIGYQPGLPQSLATWQAQTGALLVVNGGFYTEKYEATGLIIADGVATGLSYEGFGGMFLISEDGPDLRSLKAQPYDPAEPIQAALQSFPLLVKPGGEAGFPEDDGRRARRTVVAKDRHGRILFLIAPRGFFTLHGLANYLAASDLQLEVALNLDGGPSSGLLLREPPLFVPAFVPLPAVITVQRKDE